MPHFHVTSDEIGPAQILSFISDETDLSVNAAMRVAFRRSRRYHEEGSGPGVYLQFLVSTNEAVDNTALWRVWSEPLHPEADEWGEEVSRRSNTRKVSCLEKKVNLVLGTYCKCRIFPHLQYPRYSDFSANQVQVTVQSRSSKLGYHWHFNRCSCLSISSPFFT